MLNKADLLEEDDLGVVLNDFFSAVDVDRTEVFVLSALQRQNTDGFREALVKLFLEKRAAESLSSQRSG